MVRSRQSCVTKLAVKQQAKRYAICQLTNTPYSSQNTLPKVLPVLREKHALPGLEAGSGLNRHPNMKEARSNRRIFL